MIRALLLALLLTGCAKDMSYTDLNGTDQYWSTPDAAAFSGLSDVTIDAYVALDDWTPALGNRFAMWCQDSTSGFAAALAFTVNANSRPFFLGFDGSAILANATAAPSVLDGSPIWLRVSRNGTTGDVTFYTGGTDIDAPSWSQLGDVVSAASGALEDSSKTAFIGRYDSGGSTLAHGDGKVYLVRVYDDTAGTNEIARFDARRRGTPGSILSRTGETWTGQNGAVVTGVTTYGPPSFAGR